MPLRSPPPPAEQGLARRLALDAVLARAVKVERPPVQVGRHILRRKVGAGGMGVVFEATDSESGARVAVKLLEHATPELRTRFAREVHVLRRLIHPQIVRYLDDGVAEDGKPFLVMEWLEGSDLAAHLSAGPTAVEFALRVALAAACGLGAAHAAGVVHRDVKPANLFLLAGAGPEIRVIDFGIARGGEGDHHLTATGALVGTPAYMAPEQLRGEHAVASDIWGLGVTLFEMLTGRVPFGGRDPASVFIRATTEPLPSLATLRPDAPRGVEQLLVRMLARAPEERPVSMAAVVAELADLQTDLRPRTPGRLFEDRRPVSGAVEQALTLDLSEPECPTGRARAFGALEGLAAECLDDHRANVVVLEGERGLGRTHLLAALAGTLRAVEGRPAIVELACEPDLRRSPFGLLSRLVDALCGEEAAGRLAPAQDMRRLLDELLEDGSGPRPEAAVLADALRLTWTRLTEAWRLCGPRAVLVDDAQDCDPVSLRFLARAAEQLADHPTLLVLSVTGAEPRAELSAVFGPCDPTEIVLRPLAPQAISALALRWAPAWEAERRASALRLAGGNPARLRALIAAPTGSAEAPGAAPLIWARLEALAPDARRLLRAGSLVGERFDATLLAAILGGETEPGDLASHLARLVERGLLQAFAAPAGRTDQPETYAFTDPLVEATCRGLVTEDERRAAHRALARCLGERPGVSPARVARHHLAAGQAAMAAPFLLRAARAAVGAGDAAWVAVTVAEALEHPLPADARAELLLLDAESAYWGGEVGRALAQADAAWALCEHASVPWLRARALALTAAGQLGRNERLAPALDELAALPDATEPAARDALCICLGRLTTQLGVLSGIDLAPARARLADHLAKGDLSPMARAWAWRGISDLRRIHLDETIEAMTRAHAAHVEAQDHRGAAQIQVYLASYFLWTGAFARSAEVADDAARIARSLGAEYLEIWADYARGKLAVETEQFEAAEARLTRTVARTAGSPRMRAGAHLHLSIAALRAGAVDRARAAAEAVLADPTALSVHEPARAALVRALLAAGDVAGAAPHLPALAAATENLPLEFDALLLVAHVELVRAVDGVEAARVAAESARAALDRRAATVIDPLRRNAFFRGPHLNARVLDLFAELASSTDTSCQQ